MAAKPTPELIEDCFGIVKLYSDGSIFRSEIIKHKNQIYDDGSILWKDRLYNHHHNLHLRLYKPPAKTSGQNVPILYYIHAGGFCFGSRAFPNAHNSCLSLAARLRAVVVSVDFRLAPEHRLPAALEDVYCGLKWLQGEAGERCDEPWLSEGVDFGRVFVFGDSCGGNLAHHLAVRLGPRSVELEPVRVRGYVLLSPFFGGTVKTNSEVERPCETFWTQDIYDRFWRLSIPNGTTTDHPLVNPLGVPRESVEAAMVEPMLVLVGGSEIMRDRVKDYASMMEQSGKNVVYIEFEGKEHGFFTSNSYTDEVEDVIQAVASFISQNSDS